MDRTPGVALDVCASFAGDVIRRFYPFIFGIVFLSQACQRETGLQAFEPRGPRSTGIASADTAVSNSSNFNGTAIAAGRTVWFTSVFKVSGVGSSGATIDVAASKITFTAGSTPYTVTVPAAVVTIDPHATVATTTFDTASQTWRTTLPLQWSGNAFLTGAPLPLTAGLPGGINPVTWSADFVTDPPGVTINWQWAAAVYTQFASDNNNLHVKPVDDPNASAYKNSDHAGTPESYKPYVIGGARGGGGSNYTGSLSGTVSLTTHACTTTCAAPNPCQMSPVCHSDGTCSYQALPDGTTCNDGNPNTVTDKCTAGVCAGVDLCANVTCTASGECHPTGTCDHATGGCSIPSVSDGTTCVGGQCTAGLCVQSAESNQRPIVSAGADQTIYLSETSPPSTLSFELIAPLPDANVLAATPGGALVASYSGDLVKVSDAGTSTTLASLGQSLGALAIAPDGTIFAGGYYVGPKIFRVSPDGATIDPAWANYSSHDWPSSLLVGSDGSLYANDSYGLWRFDANGNGTQVAPFLGFGPIVQVPQDDRYGPFSGMIVAANDGQVTGTDTNGSTVALALNLTGVLGIRLVPPHARFLGLDGTALWEADASAFAGDLFVLTWPNGMYRVRWNGAALQANRVYPSDVGWWAIDFRAGDASGSRSAVAQLSGSAQDDGQPNPPGQLTYHWSAPAGVSIANADLASTTATFDALGAYTLTLTASDSELTGTGDTHVTVAGVNQAPVANAGGDTRVSIVDGADLSGSAHDDGVPGPLSYAWTMRSGPGTASFANASAPATHVTFDAPGTYVLQLAVSDGGLTGVDALTVQVTTREGLLISVVSPATVGPNREIPYTLAVTNTALVDYPDVQATVAGPDGNYQSVSFGPIAAGASSQASGWVSVSSTPPYWRSWWPPETNDAYLARLHALLGAPERVVANATAIDTAGAVHVGSSTSTSTIALAIVRPTSAIFSLDPFVPNQEGTLTIELVNEGSVDAHGVYADARAIREWKTIDIPVGQAAELSYVAGAPIQQAGDFTVDLQTLTDEASIYWNDEFNNGYGDTLVQWSGRATVPVLEYTATLQPAMVLPSQPLTVDAFITNVGHADALNVSLDVAFRTLASLGSFAPGEARPESGLAGFAPSVTKASDYPTSDYYLDSLRFLLLLSPLRTELNWEDLAGSRYSRNASTGSQLVLPIVSVSQGPSAAGPLYLRDVLPLDVHVLNEGTADAVATTVETGFDFNQGQTMLPVFNLAEALPVSTMPAGMDRAATIPFAVPFVPVLPSDASGYYHWLHEVAQYGLRTGVIARWSDAAGNAYGPTGQTTALSVAVPIVTAGLRHLQLTCPSSCYYIEVPWQLDLTPGAQVDVVVPWRSEGSAIARNARVTALVHGVTQTLPFPDAIPGDNGTATLHWAAPPNPTGRQTGESVDAYLTRLRTPRQNQDSRLELTWSDDRGNAFGPISETVISNVPQLYAADAKPVLVSGLPNGPVQMQIDWYPFAATASLSVTTPDRTIGLVSSSSLPLSFPGTLPAAPLRASLTSDSAYQQALAALEAASVPISWQMTWTAGSNNYGPTDGTFNATVSLPNLTARTMVAASDGQTAQRVGIAMTNIGHADATSAHVQFLSGSSLLRALDVPVPAGAVAEAAFYAPMDFIGDRFDYHYVLTWNDAAGNAYGPIRGSGAIYRGAKNQPPTVTAGPSQTVLLSKGANLAGVVADDGRPGTGLTQRWTQVSGPGWTTFADVSSAATQASFSQAGTYVLQLWASDGELVSADKTTIDVVEKMPANQAPIVSAGPPQTFTPPGSGVAPPFQMSAIATSLPNPTGLDDHGVSGSVLASVNYASGYPYNFVLVHEDGSWEQFSDVKGLSDEVYFVTGRDEDGAGHTLGGFNAGEVFAGTGVPGDILRMSPDGSVVQNPWVNLPGERGLLRGALAFDHTGVFGYDLILSTDQGGIWRVNSAGAAIQLAQLNRFLEGVMTVPNDPAKYGPWAGTILTGAESESALYTIDVQGTVTRWNLGISAPENMHLVPAGENFFGSDQHGTIYGAPAEELAPSVGQILITEEFTGTLWRVRWDGTQFVKNFMGQTLTHQFEGVGFSPAGLGPVQSQWLTAPLHGSVEDDGLPAPPAQLTTTWSKVSGPGTVLFDDPGALDTTIHVERAGTYVVRLTASDSELSATSDVTIAWNPPDQTPIVDAGGDQIVYLPSAAQLAGRVSDDGLPAGSTLTTSWSKVAGSGTVSFADATELSTTATFSAPGEYLLRLSASDGELQGTREMRVTVLAADARPFVSAGPSQTVIAPAAALKGTVQGALGEVIEIAWSAVSGPGSVTFDDAAATLTIARFSQPGMYVLKLSATLPAHSITVGDTTTVEVLATGVSNFPPVVDAGPDRLVPWPVSAASLDGKAADDGNPFGVLSVSWSQVSGPGTAQFQMPSSGSTSVTVDQPGRYVLRLTARDAELTASSDVVVTFARPGHAGPGGVWVTGHDPEASASVGQNAAGAQRQLELAMAFVAQDTVAPRLLVVTRERENYFSPAWPEAGLASIGLPRIAYDEAGAHPSGAMLDLYTVDFNKYDIVLVVSDEPGPLSQSELDVLRVRSNDLRLFVNAGGSIIASAESGLRPDGVDQVRTNLFGFLSLPGSPVPTQQAGTGNVITAAGAQIGLTNADVNGDPTWVTFAASGAMNVVEVDSQGRILTLAARDQSLRSSGTPANNPPMVIVPPPSYVHLDQAARLAGSVSDDGLPTGAAVTAVWTQVAGPGMTTFADPSSASTTATFSRAGRYILRLTASDTELSGSADMLVDVFEPNNPPIVSGGPDQDIATYSTKLAGSVVDDGRPQGAPLSWGWQEESGPGIVQFADPLSLSTVATFTEPGTYVLRLWANDTEFYAQSEVVIHVQDAFGRNQAPFVDVGPNPLYVTLSGSSVQATLLGTVVDDGLPSNVTHSLWSLARGPAAVQFSDATLARTTASFTAPGTYTLRLSATDTALTTTSALIVVVLGETNQPPTVGAGTYAALPYPQRDLRLAGTVADDGNPTGSHVVSTWSLRAGEGTATFDDMHDLNTLAHFSWPGQYVLHLDATDGELFSFDEVVVTVGAAPGDAPVVALTAPDDGARVTAPVDVIGSVSDGQWQLEVALGGDDAGSKSWKSIGSGTGAISGVLGTLDPTVLLNGTWSLRLRAVTEGGTGEDQRSVIVDKNLKIGTFAFSVTDMTVPVPGLPVQVIRSYDSRDGRDGDFGHGWSLSLSDVRLEKTVVLGKFWGETISGSYAFPSYCLAPTRPDVVTVTFASGKVYRFDASLSIKCQLALPIETPELQFTPQQGTVGSLRVLDTSPTVYVSRPFGLGASAQLLDSDGSVYNPPDFVLTSEDGTQYAIHQGSGLEWVQDRNGNKLIFSQQGIISSAGKSVAFVRDAQGHISEITDPNGNSLLYGYDQRGDLVSFTDRAGNTTQFAYGPAHQLLSITDPRGKQVLGNRYDDAGRLISTDDAAGKSIIFGHDPAHHLETVTDRSGKTTTYEYDPDGNVVHLIDALQHETFSSYDENDNKLSETDALGHTTRWTYDARNNKTSEKDPLGHETKWTYDTFGNVVTIEDPLHHVTVNERATIAVCGQATPSGNLLSVTNAKNEKTSYTYNCDGTVATQKDARDALTTYAYAGGLLQSVTDGLANIISYTYDANGNQKTETRTRMVDGVSETLVTSYEYDGNGQRTKMTYPDGTFTRTDYDEIGKPKSTFDQLGRETKYTYDDQGRLSVTTYPDQTTSSTTYDENARRKTSTDRGGRTTSFGYDDVGRLKTTTHADNSARTTEYDEVGRVKRTLDELGHPTSYGYDDAGRRIGVTDALGKSTTFAYDDAGNQISVTDANQNTVSYGHDELNRQVRVTYPDTTYETTEYDAQGNRSARVDQAGIRTGYGYDLLARLTSVTNKNVNGVDLITRYGYDELGNRTSQTDANSHTTAIKYDGLGRRISRTLPLRQIETFTYYADGQVKTRTDFNGHTTTYAYDNAGRLIMRTPDPFFALESPVIFTYWPSGRRKTMSDSTGVTSYAYDERDRLLTRSPPEGVLTYTYDVAGNRTAVQSDSGAYHVTYVYDDLNRLRSVTDNVAGGGTTAYDYDDTGRLTSYDYPNTISTTFVYDALNRVQSTRIGSGLATGEERLLASYAYTFYPTGNRRTVSELMGRTVTWGYDTLWRLTSETIAGSAISGSTGYNYDAVGNRLSRTSTMPGIAAQSNAYDANDRSLSDGWDPNGNTMTDGLGQYSYDSENRLLALNRNSETPDFAYDGDGQLVSRTVGGVMTTYLVDAHNPTGYTQIAEERISGVAQKSYVYGLQRISLRDSAGLHYYGYDAHSGVRMLFDSSGNSTDSYDYDAFGVVIRLAGSTTNGFTYRGEQTDASLTLQYLRARWLDLSRGMFRTRDPFEDELASDIHLNKYIYVLQDPVNKTDPLGYCDCTVSSQTIGTSAAFSTSIESTRPRF